MSKIRTVCVYCGSGPGNHPAFIAAARKFGRILAENHIRLVYGGGSVGLMGALAKSVLEHGGEVTGIIPDGRIGTGVRSARSSASSMPSAAATSASG